MIKNSSMQLEMIPCPRCREDFPKLRLEKYGYNFLAKWGQIKTPISSSIQFKILGFLRKINQKYFKKHSNRIGMEGTIYGDMQRGKLN